MNQTVHDAVPYSIYAAGFLVGSISPDEWLIYLSIVGVIIRLPVELYKLYQTYDDCTLMRAIKLHIRRLQREKKK